MSESIKLDNNKYIDTTGIYDETQGQTQAQINQSMQSGKLDTYSFPEGQTEVTSYTYELTGGVYLFTFSHISWGTCLYIVNCLYTPYTCTATFIGGASDLVSSVTSTSNTISFNVRSDVRCRFSILKVGESR